MTRSEYETLKIGDWVMGKTLTGSGILGPITETDSLMDRARVGDDEIGGWCHYADIERCGYSNNTNQETA